MDASTVQSGGGRQSGKNIKILKKNKKTKKTAAPSIPMWSPTIVLTRPALAYLRRSDGMRSVQVCMAAAMVETIAGIYIMVDA